MPTYSGEYRLADLTIGVESVQGKRKAMEDAHVCLRDVSGIQPGVNASYFAVYDGHGGTRTSKFAEENMHKTVLADPAFAAGDVEAALRSAFAATDQAFLKIAAANSFPVSFFPPSFCII